MISRFSTRLALKINTGVLQLPCCRAAGARRPVAGRPGGPAAPLPGDRSSWGFSAKNFAKFLQKSPCRPVAGRPGPGRPAAGRPAPPPLYKGWLVPPLLICITKIPETKKREGGREAKPCQIFEPATASNQNSSMLYK